MSRVSQRLLTLAAAGLAAATLAPPAQAMEFLGSDKSPGKTLFRFTLGGDIPLIDPVGLNATVRVYPGAADLFGVQGNAMLLDGEASVLAKFEIPTPLAGIGIKPYLAPYLGARYMAVPELRFATANTGQFSQMAGPTYGLRAIVKLPLDLSVWAYGGLSTFVWGSRNSIGLDGQSSGSGIATQNATVPTFGANVNWSPLGLFTVYAGAETSQLPVNLMAGGTIAGSPNASVSGFSLGLRFLFFSI
jgi:hypothetical protein